MVASSSSALRPATPCRFLRVPGVGQVVQGPHPICLEARDPPCEAHTGLDPFPPRPSCSPCPHSGFGLFASWAVLQPPASWSPQPGLGLPWAVPDFASLAVAATEGGGFLCKAKAMASVRRAETLCPLASPRLGAPWAVRRPLWLDRPSTCLRADLGLRLRAVASCTQTLTRLHPLRSSAQSPLVLSHL